MRLDVHFHKIRIFRARKRSIRGATHRTVLVPRRDIMHFFAHGQLRPGRPPMTFTGFLLPALPRTGRLPGLVPRPLFTLFPVQPLSQIPDFRLVGCNFLLEGGLAGSSPIILGLPVARGPLQLDVCFVSSTVWRAKGATSLPCSNSSSAPALPCGKALAMASFYSTFCATALLWLARDTG
jgi:hypothetical protein